MTAAALPARMTPPRDAVKGVSSLEEELLGTLERDWDKAIRDFQKVAKRQPNEYETRRLLSQVVKGLGDAFARLGQEYIGKAYHLGMRADFTEAAFDHRDEVVIKFLESQPQLLSGALSTVIRDGEGVMARELRRSLEEGLNSGAAIRRSATALGEEYHKVENVVRSETTRIVNQARAEQFIKYGQDDDRYRWITAMRGGKPDDRVENICLAIAYEDPATMNRPKLWKLADLRRATNLGFGDFLPHPRCRCTLRRHIER